MKTTIKVKNPEQNKERIQELLKRFIKIREDGCWQWTGSYYNTDYDKSPRVIFNGINFHPKYVLHEELWNVIFCNLCSYEWCECENRKWVEVSIKCDYEHCLNKEHFFIFNSGQFFVDYIKNKLTVDELSKKFYLTTDAVDNWIKGYNEEPDYYQKYLCD